MDKNFKDLLNKFKNICDKKWIPSVSNGHGTIGLTFEHELGKKVDTNYTPDYKDIEIKCSTRYSRHNITLFSIAFDGPSKKEIIRLNDNYGSADTDFPDKKTLMKTFNSNHLSQIKSGYYLSLEVNKDKLYLLVYDKNKNLIEKQSYIYLETIKKHLLTKVNKLAYIKGSKKKIDDKVYFRYYEIYLYILKSFDVFIELLLNGDIDVTIMSRISKSGSSAGRYFNKNLIFQIKQKNIEKLFNFLHYYNHDKKIALNDYQQIDDFQIL